MTTKEKILAEIKDINYAYNDCSKYATIKNLLDEMEEEMVEERKKGKWIRNANGTYSCSLCQSWIPNEQWYYANYCLFCGADMREEKNDESN